MTAVSRPLGVNPCRRECRWSASGEAIDGLPVFACASCGSEWVASEPWTPADWTGAVPDAVQAERELRGRRWQPGQK